MNHRATSEALRAQAIAEVTAEHWTHVFHAMVPRDDRRPVCRNEVLTLFPDEASILCFVEETYGPTSLIARLEDCMVEARLEQCIVHLCVAAHSAEVARQVAKAIQERVPAPPPTDSNTVDLAVWSKTETGPRSRQTSVTVPIWSEVKRNYPTATRGQLARHPAQHGSTTVEPSYPAGSSIPFVEMAKWQ